MLVTGPPSFLAVSPSFCPIEISANRVEEPKDGYQYATILAALVAPLSRGNVSINSADTNVLPTINTAYLRSPTDQAVAIAAYKRVRLAFASSFMQQVVIGEEYYPGMQVATDKEILDVSDLLDDVSVASYMLFS